MPWQGRARSHPARLRQRRAQPHPAVASQRLHYPLLHLCRSGALAFWEEINNAEDENDVEQIPATALV